MSTSRSQFAGQRRIISLLESRRPLCSAGQAERFVGYALWLLFAVVLLWTGT